MILNLFEASSLCKSYILSVMDNLKSLYNSVIEEDIQNLVKDIYQYKKVAAFGYMQSENIALKLAV